MSLVDGTPTITVGMTTYEIHALKPVVYQQRQLKG